MIGVVSVDTLLLIADGLFEEARDPHFAAPRLFTPVVTAGHGALKAARGFYEYY